MLDEALEFSMICKDASAYNIQFEGCRPVFIDQLSFEIQDKSRPWAAYLQFCRHFLAPLSLMALRSPDCGRMLYGWIEGLPLELATQLLPWRTRLSPCLGIHIHLHARMQKKYGDGRIAAKKMKKLHFDADSVKKLSKSLRLSCETLHLPAALRTEWGDYYNDTNYSSEAASDKKHFIEMIAGSVSKHDLAIDLGANQGAYSRVLAKFFDYVLATDIDYLAVEKLFQSLHGENIANILPLVIDLGNPSPGLGWGHVERENLAQRCRADLLMSLALVHHLFFTTGIPLDKIASYFSQLVNDGGKLIFEFVPVEDSQVQRLLAARSVETDEYTLDACIKAFSPHFTLEQQHKIVDSARSLLVFAKKSA